jgi:hypothetical protein
MTLDFTALGRAVRQNALDAHEELPNVSIGYSFMCDSRDCFDLDWDLKLPADPPAEFVAAYYGYEIRFECDEEGAGFDFLVSGEVIGSEWCEGKSADWAKEQALDYLRHESPEYDLHCAEA